MVHLLLRQCVNVKMMPVSLCVLCLVALSRLGSCFMKKGKTDEAENILRESLDLKTSACPDNKAGIAMSKLLSCLPVTHGYVLDVLVERSLQAS